MKEAFNLYTLERMTPESFWSNFLISPSQVSSRGINECDEPVVIVQDLTDEFECHQNSESMRPFVGDKLVVRSEVAMKLIRAQHWIDKRRPGVKLCLLYGYRHPEIQKKHFDLIWQDLKSKHPTMSEAELFDLTNQFIAAPEIAGHTTGGAIDIMLIQNGNYLSFGTEPTVFDQDIPPSKYQTFSSLITNEESGNRLFLREALMTQGFAPFNGEWWHFSYGDRDWAYFYQNQNAIYGIVDFDEVKELLLEQ